MGDDIYLDYNATTPIALEVLEAMRPFLEREYGNPSSGHAFGRRARGAVDRARDQVAALLGAQPDEIVFTSGATEANNLAIRGVAQAHLRDRGLHLCTSAVEHPSVAEPCARLAHTGFKLTTVPVDPAGVVSPAAVENELRPDTVLVTVMHANNEMGAIQPVDRIAALCRARGILVHTDAAQTVGKIRANVDELGVDLLTVAGHKMYAPKGVGALYIRRRTRIVPMNLGAGHERGLRAGTENVASIVGLGAACQLAVRQHPAALYAMAERLVAGLREGVQGLAVHGDPARGLPNTVNVSAPGTTGRAWLDRAGRVAASVGAACHDGVDAPSAVLTAMGVPADRAIGAIRLSVGRQTTQAEVDEAIALLAAAARPSS